MIFLKRIRNLLRGIASDLRRSVAHYNLANHHNSPTANVIATTRIMAPAIMVAPILMTSHLED